MNTTSEIAAQTLYGHSLVRAPIFYTTFRTKEAKKDNVTFEADFLTTNENSREIQCLKSNGSIKLLYQ